MIRSMTGFARAEVSDAKVVVAVEARSVNHRHLEVAIRLPRGMAGFEMDARRLVQARLERGRVDVTVQLSPITGASLQQVRVDPAMARSWLAEARALGETLGLESRVDLAWILETTAGDFVSSGALAPLKATFEGIDGYDLPDVTQSALALWTADGEIYAYPFSTSPFAMFVNNDVIKAAGQKTPAELIAAGEWTWDNANAINTAVAASGKQGLIVRDFGTPRSDTIISGSCLPPSRLAKT